MFRVQYRLTVAYCVFYELIYSTVVLYGNNFINVLHVESFNIEALFHKNKALNIHKLYLNKSSDI
jgi:hypothetical protein